jgi:hypothetical protein
MKTQTSARSTSLASCLAPEDISKGDYVAVLSQTSEYPSFLWGCDSAIRQAEDPVRINLESVADGSPLRVVAICLPFVFVREPSRQYRTIDIRLTRLAKLDHGYAKTVIRLARKPRPKRPDAALSGPAW